MEHVGVALKALAKAVKKAAVPSKTPFTFTLDQTASQSMQKELPQFRQIRNMFMVKRLTAW